MQDFDQDYAWSIGDGARDVRAVLGDPFLFPGAVEVEDASKAEDRKGTDYWVRLANGRRISVDVKLRAPDFAEFGFDDLTLETWSKIEERVPGWTRDAAKQTDYVLFFWPDTGRWCLIPFLPLCAVFTECWRDWRRIYKTNISETVAAGGYVWHSEAVYVPRLVVLGLIEEKYCGYRRGDADNATESRA